MIDSESRRMLNRMTLIGAGLGLDRFSGHWSQRQSSRASTLEAATMKDDFFRLMARYVPLVGLVPASILAGYLIGYALDSAFATAFLRYVFGGLGIVSGLVQLIRILGHDTE